MCSDVRAWPRLPEGSPTCTWLILCTRRLRAHVQCVQSRPCQAWGSILEPEGERPCGPTMSDCKGPTHTACVHA